MQAHALTLALTSLCLTCLLTRADNVTVEVDTAQPQGAVKDLLGVNKGPTFSAKQGSTTYDATLLYAQFGITQARLHDSGIDLCTIYKAATRTNAANSTPVLGCTLTSSGGIPHFIWTPTSSADSDLNNPDNYDFSVADEQLSKSAAAGAKIYLGLAQNYNGPNDTTDPVSWAKVATNIYKHVIGVFKPTTGIALDPAFVEIHNEPDGGFWRGDAATFLTLYKETTQRVRTAAGAAGHAVVVGGPGFTRDVLTNSKQSGNVANGFISAAGAGTLDFYSAHLYDKCATATLPASATFLRSLRALVDAQGGSGMPIHISEWNIGLGNDCGESLYADQRTQSYDAGILILMQDPAQAITAAHYYAGVTVMSLFDFNSAPGSVKVNPSAWAFWAFNQLKGATVLSTQVCPQSGSCVAGYAAESMSVMAYSGKTNDRQLTIITNDSASTVSYTFRAKGLSGSSANLIIHNPPQGTQTLAVTGNPAAPSSSAVSAMMASISDTTLNAQAINNGQLSTSLSIPAHSLQLIELQGASSGPTQTQLDCLFNWGEKSYPSLLSPAAQLSQSQAPYYYRYYASSHSYVGSSSTDQHLYYLASDGRLLDLGAATGWVATAGCQ
jgi:hypothetical protein